MSSKRYKKLPEKTQDLTTVVYNEWKTSIWGMWEAHNNCFLNLEAK